ncbi:unnamed protein product [Durusdinium trenchii]|uniref:Uncharacterized protein n=2 Tax=Durusdinium trenchii TaxID=1381693 RepID=A0ABP0HQB1_9DINO
MVSSCASDHPSKKRRQSSEQDTVAVKHPDIDELVKAMSGMRTRTSACRRLRDIADLESQRDFVVTAGAPAAALRLLGGPKAASSAAAQLLETLVTSAEVRRTCSAFGGISKLLAEAAADAGIDKTGRSSAVAVLATLLFTSPQLAASSAFVIHPAITLLRAPDIPRGRECAAKILASLAGVEAHATTMVDSGAVLDLAAALSGPEQRWAALALRQLARGVEARKAVIPVHAALVELLKLEITPAARVAATEALGFLAEDEEMRLHLRREAAVFLRGLSSQDPYCQEAASRVLLRLLLNSGESSEYDEDFAQALADQAALRALPTGPAFLQHLQATSGNEEKRIEAGRTRRGPLGSPSHAACD